MPSQSTTRRSKLPTSMTILSAVRPASLNVISRPSPTSRQPQPTTPPINLHSVASKRRTSQKQLKRLSRATQPSSTYSKNSMKPPPMIAPRKTITALPPSHRLHLVSSTNTTDLRRKAPRSARHPAQLRIAPRHVSPNASRWIQPTRLQNT